MSDEFIIPFTELDAGGKEYRFVVRPAWMQGQLEGHEAKPTHKDGSVVVRASKSGPDVVVNGKLEAELMVPCARCLEPFSLALRADVAVLYAPAAKLKTSDKTEYEFSSDEADTLPFDGETVVLDDLVKDELLLEIPMIPLCSETCPGMGTPSGTEENAGKKPIDPRLLPLMAFRPKK